MPTLDYGQQLPAGTAPFTQQYMDTAQKGYLASMKDPRRAAQQSLMDEYTSRGLQNSGLYGQALSEQRQGFDNEDAQFRQNLGVQGAQLGEQNRVRDLMRSWQVQDRDFRAGQLKDQMDAQKQAQQDAMWGEILGGVGTVVGGIYGGAPGAMIGNQAGKSAGAAISGANKKTTSYMGGHESDDLGDELPAQESWGAPF